MVGEHGREIRVRHGSSVVVGEEIGVVISFVCLHMFTVGHKSVFRVPRRKPKLVMHTTVERTYNGTFDNMPKLFMDERELVEEVARSGSIWLDSDES